MKKNKHQHLKPAPGPAPAPASDPAPKLGPSPAPTVGRIVHFHALDLAVPLAALITKIHTSESAQAMGACSLTIFTPSGLVFEAYVTYSEKPATKQWSWPARS